MAKRLFKIASKKSTGDFIKLNGDFSKNEYFALINFLVANKEGYPAVNAFYKQCSRETGMYSYQDNSTFHHYQIRGW
ncbi:hypothetical protein HC864_00970 [Candidatus Gracilibacteria bacterium]|nr:hypothetical protein [Thermales bacterium]NJL96382.1 hypothetical protein [Candidatus Gracilibacteria bacterium]